MIRNMTRSTVLCRHTEVAATAWRKAIGLMGRKRLGNSGLLMVFSKEGRPGIWMLGMRFPIDLVFLDRRKRVVDIRKNIQPIGFHPKTWMIYYPKRPARYVIELPAGTVKRTATARGDKIIVGVV